MKYSLWESCWHDGWRVCSLPMTNATVRPIHLDVGRFWSATRRSLCVAPSSSLWYGSTIMQRRPNNTQNREPAPKKARTILGTGKGLTTIFWESQDVIYIDFLKTGRFNAELRKKRQCTTFFLFPNLETWLPRQKCGSNETYLVDLQKIWLLLG